MRNWLNYLSDVEACLETETDEAILSELQFVCHQGTATKKVLDGIVRFGMSHKSAADLYDSQKHWLSLQTPPVPDPFSMYFKKTMNSIGCQDAWPATDFWSRLSDIVLTEFCPTLDVLEVA